MQLNSIIFPKPECSYDDNDPQIIQVTSNFPPPEQSFISSLFQKKQSNKFHQIPCLLMEYENSDLYMLFFHGNAEDLGYAREFLQEIQNELQINMIAMEYPSYGTYTDRQQPNEEQIEQDAESVYLYITNRLKVPQSQIILFGRSMGGGPACYLASKFQPRCLVLMSVFSSLKNVAIQHANVFGYLVKDRFPNAERALSITCPTILIHGKSDNLIPFTQSEEIYQNLKSDLKEKIFPEKMSHNYFDMNLDLLEPVSLFLKDVVDDIEKNLEKTFNLPKKTQMPSMWNQQQKF